MLPASLSAEHLSLAGLEGRTGGGTAQEEGLAQSPNRFRELHHLGHLLRLQTSGKKKNNALIQGLRIFWTSRQVVVTRKTRAMREVPRVLFLFVVSDFVSAFFFFFLIRRHLHQTRRKFFVIFIFLFCATCSLFNKELLDRNFVGNLFIFFLFFLKKKVFLRFSCLSYVLRSMPWGCCYFFFQIVFFSFEVLFKRKILRPPKKRKRFVPTATKSEIENKKKEAGGGHVPALRLDLFFVFSITFCFLVCQVYTTICSCLAHTNTAVKPG